jgi:hypothetical protein
MAQNAKSKTRAAALGCNPGDSIGVPNIRVDFSAHVLELVEILDRSLAIAHGHAPRFARGLWIDEAKSVRPVAENKFPLIVSEAPPFPRITEHAQRPEADQIVDEGDLGPPGQLDQLPVPFRQAFPKVNGIKTMLLDHTAGF